MGILIALAAMWFVFDRIWPVRTTAVMRRGFATVMGLNADLFTRMNSSEPHTVVLRDADLLRDRLGRTVADLRTMNGSVAYEFGTNRVQQIHLGDTILRATLSTVALFWHQFAVLHTGSESSYLLSPELRTMRSEVAASLRAMAEAVTQHTAVDPPHADAFISERLLHDPEFGEYARNTAARYEELRDLTMSLSV